MCGIGGGGGKTQVVKNIIPQSTPLPEKAPEPVEIAKESQDKMKRRRNPLRIDLASSAPSATPSTGVNV